MTLRKEHIYAMQLNIERPSIAECQLMDTTCRVINSAVKWGFHNKRDASVESA